MALYTKKETINVPMKSLIQLILLFILPVISQAQDTTTTNDFIITLRKDIWFYPGEAYPRSTTISNRFSIRATESIKFTTKPGYTYYKAEYKNRPGFVEAIEVSFENQHFDPTKIIAVDMKTLMINSAGTKIRKGANAVVFGTIFSLGGSIAGLLIAKNDPDLGYAIAAGSGALGLVINLAGLGGIAGGGRKMEEAK